MLTRRFAALAAVVILLFGATGCLGFPDTPAGNFLGLANAEVGTTPAYAAQGFWCYLFVNQVGEDTISGWADAQGPGSYSGESLLLPDPLGPMAGDVVEFGDPTQHDQVIHVGIVLAVGGTSFASIEGNSSTDPNAIVVNYHPTVGPDPSSGLEPVAFLLP